MMGRFTGALLAGILGAALQGMAAVPEFPRAAKIEKMSSVQSSPFSRFLLNSEVYRVTDNLFADLRVRDAEGRDVPFLVERYMLYEPKPYSASKETSLLSFRQNGDRAELIVSSDGREAVNSLEIRTPERNFEKKLTIYGSMDQKNWTLLAEKLPFFDYSSKVDLRQTVFAMPENQYRYYKLVFANYAENVASPFSTVTLTGDGEKQQEVRNYSRRELKIEQVRLGWQKQNVAAKPGVVDYPVTVQERNEDAFTVLEVVSAREPLTKLKISSSTPDYNRRAQVFGVDADGDRRLLGDGTLRRVSFAKDGNDGGIAIPESRFEKYEIRIWNGDNRPLENLQVAASGSGYQVVMLNLPEGCRLYYGAAARKPEYDIAALLAYGQMRGYVDWKLGAVEELGPVKSGRPFDYRLLFGVCIGLAALVLLGILWKCCGRIVPADDESRDL